MNASGRRFSALAGSYAVSRLSAGASVPEWASGEFVSITATADELSIVCPEARVPATVRAERGWRVLKLAGPIPFGEVGVLVAVAAPLALAGIAMLAVATHDTDYLLVKSAAFDNAVAALRAAGHTLGD